VNAADRPWRDLLANVSPEVRGELPLAFTDILSRVAAYEQVDWDRRSKGWGYKSVRIVSIDEAWAPPINRRA
jgi:hypothetical protein